MRFTRMIAAGLMAAMLAGCMSSGRLSAIEGNKEPEVQPVAASHSDANIEPSPSRWSVLCAQQGAKKACGIGLKLANKDASWLHAYTTNEAAGTMTLAFVVPIEAKPFGAVVVESDSGVSSILHLKQERCSAKDCNVLWVLSREQKEKLLSGKTLRVQYALNNGVNQEFVLSSHELKAGLAKL